MMELIERFVVAVERIAGAMESRAVSIAVAAEVLEEHREAVNLVEEPTETEDFPVAAGPAANGQELVDREKIKKELDALGVEYGPKTRTGTLLQLLEAARALDQQVAPPEEDPTVGETGTWVAPEDALNQIREGLKQLAYQEGRDAAMEILETHGGGAKNVSGVAPEFYGPLLNALGGVA
jgi:hypothetical protein